MFPCLSAFVLLALAIPALADTPTPASSYKLITPGDRFVFVMISPHPVEQDTAGSRNDENAARIREIRRVFARSGMYRNDGSVEPLWSVDWYAMDVKLSSDGVHLVRQGPWAFLPAVRLHDFETALDQEAVSFFADGRLLRTYQIRELVDDQDHLTRSVSHLHWKKDGNLNDERLEYTLTTLDDNQFVFDVRTGAIVSESRARHFSRWCWWVALGMVAVGIVSWIAWRRRMGSRVVSS